MSRREQQRALGGRGYFGVAVYRPKCEANIGSLWRSADLFGASFLATIGHRYPRRQASDTTNAAMHVPMLHYSCLDELIAGLPYSCPLVGVEMDPRATELAQFTHPERALYLLGAEDHGLPQVVIDHCHRLVQIPTVKPYSLNVAVAGSCVLFDRHSKVLARELVTR